MRLSVQLVHGRDERIAWAWSAPLLTGDVLRVAELLADSVAEHALGPGRGAESKSLRGARRVDPAAFELRGPGRGRR